MTKNDTILYDLCDLLYDALCILEVADVAEEQKDELKGKLMMLQAEIE